MNTLVKTIFAATLLVSTPTLAEEAHHTSSGAAETAATDATPPQDMKGNLPGGGMGMMNADMMNQMTEMHARMMRGMMSSRGMGQEAMRQMMSSERVEGRIAFLRAELKITAAQQSHWDAVAGAIRAEATASKGMPSMIPGDMMQPDAGRKTLPQELSGMERALSSRLDGLRRLNAVLAPFYEALDESQKTTADELLWPMSIM